MHRRRPGEDAVEVEQADADGIREAEGPGSWHGRDGTGAALPGIGWRTGCASAPAVTVRRRRPDRAGASRRA